MWRRRRRVATPPFLPIHQFKLMEQPIKYSEQLEAVRNLLKNVQHQPLKPLHMVDVFQTVCINHHFQDEIDEILKMQIWVFCTGTEAPPSSVVPQPCPVAATPSSSHLQGENLPPLNAPGITHYEGLSIREYANRPRTRVAVQGKSHKIASARVNRKRKSMRRRECEVNYEEVNRKRGRGGEGEGEFDVDVDCVFKDDGAVVPTDIVTFFSKSTEMRSSSDDDGAVVSTTVRPKEKKKSCSLVDRRESKKARKEQRAVGNHGTKRETGSPSTDAGAQDVSPVIHEASHGSRNHRITQLVPSSTDQVIIHRPEELQGPLNLIDQKKR
ncbi:hypothetical protein LXL04_006353 [Taraxacum kok-saghyz]